MRHPYTTMSSLLILLSCAACAGRLESSDPARWGQAALESRVAALAGHNDAYLEKLIETADRLRSKVDRFPERTALLFALDELADIYTYRAVDFSKALLISREAVQLLDNTECCTGKLRAKELFFPHRRLAYAFLFHDPENTFVTDFGSPQDLSTLAGERTLFPSDFSEVFGNTAGAKTLFPADFLSVVETEDRRRLTNRIRNRLAFLESVVGSSSAEITRTPQGPFADPTLSGVEVVTWGKLIESAIPSRPHTQWALFLERLWASHDEVDEQGWLHLIADATAKAIAAEAASTNIAWKDIILVRFRSGLAHLRLGHTQQGVRLFEEMLKFVEAHDQAIAAFNDKLLTEKEIKRSTSRAMAIGGLTINIIASLIGGGKYGTVYTPSGSTNQNVDYQLLQQMTQLWADEKDYRVADAQLQVLFGQSRPGLRGILNEHEQMTFHYELGYAYEKLGQKRKAIQEYKLAVDIVERQRGTIPSGQGRVHFLKDKEGAYKRLIPLLIEEGDVQGAMEYMERARSRAFVELLASGRPEFASKEESSQYQSVLEREAELSVIEQQRSMPRQEAEQFRHSLRSRAVLQEQGTPTIPLGTVRYPELESLAVVQAAAIKDISPLLGPEAALLSFFVSDERTAVILIQDGIASGWVKPVGRTALASQIQNFRRHLQVPHYPSPNRALPEIERLGQQLFRDLLEDTAPLVKKRLLYIAPHGPLHYLPFAALHDGSGYLLDRFAFVTIPGGTVLTYLAKKPISTQGSTVVLANPDLEDIAMDLPFADEEGNMIRSIRPDALLYRRRAALEERAKKLAPGARVLHFATHASFVENKPMDSSVILVPGDGEDGRLRVAEIFGLRLPGSLVVLSGCETGMGQLASGDELIGLTRAFMYAGSPQLLATLWKIDDRATSDLMAEFYGQLAARSKVEALRQAQLSIRRRYAHPFYWASFVFYGFAGTHS